LQTPLLGGELKIHAAIPSWPAARDGLPEFQRYSTLPQRRNSAGRPVFLSADDLR
jgi:hypothetical protein